MACLFLPVLCENHWLAQEFPKEPDQIQRRTVGTEASFSPGNCWINKDNISTGCVAKYIFSLKLEKQNKPASTAVDSNFLTNWYLSDKQNWAQINNQCLFAVAVCDAGEGVDHVVFVWLCDSDSNAAQDYEVFNWKQRSNLGGVAVFEDEEIVK